MLAYNSSDAEYARESGFVLWGVNPPKPILNTHGINENFGVQLAHLMMHGPRLVIGNKQHAPNESIENVETVNTGDNALGVTRQFTLLPPLVCSQGGRIETILRDGQTLHLLETVDYLRAQRELAELYACYETITYIAVVYGCSDPQERVGVGRVKFTHTSMVVRLMEEYIANYMSTNSMWWSLVNQIKNKNYTLTDSESYPVVLDTVITIFSVFNTTRDTYLSMLTRMVHATTMVKNVNSRLGEKTRLVEYTRDSNEKGNQADEEYLRAIHTLHDDVRTLTRSSRICSVQPYGTVTFASAVNVESGCGFKCKFY